MTVGEIDHRRRGAAQFTEIDHCEWAPIGDHRRFESIPVVVEDAGNIFERCRSTFGDLDAQNHRPLDQRMTGNVGELRVEPCTPARVEGKDGLHLVEYVEARRHACFDRMLGEHALRETVQRRDRGDVGLLQGRSTALVSIAARLACPPFERGAHPISQLGGGCFGERDRRDVLQFDAFDHDQVDDAIDDGGGLAGSGARFDEQRVAQAVEGDQPARASVDQRGRGRGGVVEVEQRLLAFVGLGAAAAHWSLSLSCTGPRSVTNDSVAGSSCFACQCAPRSRGQRRSKSQ